MIGNLTRRIINIIKGDDLQEVYSTFDGISVENKSENFITIVSPSGFCGKDVSVIKEGTAYSFEIIFDAICLADDEYSAIEFYDFIQNKIIERIISTANQMTVSEFETSSPEYDLKFKRMKITTRFKISGVYILEESEEGNI